MKKLISILTPLALAASAVSAQEQPSAEAAQAMQETSEKLVQLPDFAPVPIEGPEGQKLELVKVATLPTAPEYEQFQRNVQVLRNQQQIIQAMRITIASTEDEETRENLKKELERALQKIQADNRKMMDIYGYSIEREYEIVVERAHIYMYVTEAEADEIRSYEEPEDGTEDAREKAREDILFPMAE